MKICSKCGAYNSDDRFFCVDCGEKLDLQLSEEQGRKLTRNKIDKMYAKGDPLHVGKLEKILGYASLIAAFLCVCLFVVGKILNRPLTAVLIGASLFVVAAVDLLVPQLAWSLEKLRFSFSVFGTDGLIPSRFYVVCKWIAVAVCIVAGLFFMTNAALDFKHPPILKYISDIAAQDVGIDSDDNGNYLISQPWEETFARLDAHISTSPEKWQKIIAEGDYTVDIFLVALKKAKTTGVKEQLMMKAIDDINGIQRTDYSNKDYYLLIYR